MAHRSKPGSIRRARALLALVVTLTLVAPGLSQAHHLGSRYPNLDDHPDTMGPFGPSFTVLPASVVTDLGSVLRVQSGHGDHEEIVRTYRVAIPAGWRFSVGSIPRAAAPITRCADATPSNIAARMEAVGTMWVQLHTDRTRDPNTYGVPFTDDYDPPDTRAGQDGRAHYGAAPGSNYGGIPGGGDHRALWFLGWDNETKTATFCGLISTMNTRIPRDDQTLMVQVSLQLQADSSWILSWDFVAVPGEENATGAARRSVIDKPSFQDGNVSILQAGLQFNHETAGNYNQCGTTCPNTGFTAGSRQIPWVRSPVDPGASVFTGTFVPCAPDDPLPCKSNATPAVRRQTIQVVIPSDLVRNSARFTGPSGPVGMPPGFALLRGTSQVDFTWKQPATHPSFPVKGYVLAVGVFGNQNAIHLEYLVTNPAYQTSLPPGGEAPTNPCGEDGKEKDCTLTLRFPLSTNGGTALPPDGKYGAVLTTVYGDGARSDGWCDDGTPNGAVCPAGFPQIKVAPYSNAELWREGGKHGVSGREFMIRKDPWPEAYVEVQNDGKQAFYLLLADYGAGQEVDRGRAEFIIWNPRTQHQTFVGSGAGIQGVNGAGGTVSFGVHFGTYEQYRFDGATSAAGARGLFLKYDIRKVQDQINKRTVGAELPPTPSDPLTYSAELDRYVAQRQIFGARCAREFGASSSCDPCPQFALFCEPLEGTKL